MFQVWVALRATPGGTLQVAGVFANPEEAAEAAGGGPVVQTVIGRRNASGQCEVPVAGIPRHSTVWAVLDATYNKGQDHFTADVRLFSSEEAAAAACPTPYSPESYVVRAEVDGPGGDLMRYLEAPDDGDND
jgi:hypothetical protein